MLNNADIVSDSGVALRSYRSINWKLGRLVLIAVGVALLIGSAVSLWQEVRRYGMQKRDVLLATAHVFSAASAVAVESGNKREIFNAIRAIGRIPGIVYVSVEDQDGRLLTELGQAVRLSNDIDISDEVYSSAFSLLQSRSLLASVTVVSGGRPVGTLTLITDTSDLAGRLWNIVATGLASALLAAFIGLGISIRLQRQITRPLMALSRTMATIRVSHDYDARVPIASNDEIGLLASSFNTMIGEIRKRDFRLERHREHLEQEVTARTQDLRAAKEVAEDASVAKSAFLATMSHEIRTPMNGMLVMAELLASSDLPDRQRRYAEVIARSGQSLLAIINDILDFAKVESGKLELEKIPVDIEDVVGTVTTLFGERAHAQGIDLAAVVATSCPPRILGDPVRLTQILSNLVNNALKFTQSGHVLVRIAPDVERAEHLRISVEDTGIGIPSEKLGAIFSAFSQADQSTTRQFGGTGLGLSICKRLVEAMEGEIRVTSEPGIGSCFSFSIPIEAVPGSGAVTAVVAPARHALPVVVSVEGAATLAALSVLLPANGFAMIAGGEVDAFKAEAADAFWLVNARDLLAAGERPAGAKVVVAMAAIGDACGEEAVARDLADGLMRLPLANGEVSEILGRIYRGENLTESKLPNSDGTALPQFENVRVLVADDSAINREVACEALSRLRISGATAENGREAFEAAVAQQFDCIFMDVSMPEMDGYESCRQIRLYEADNGLSRVPIIALTAHVVGPDAHAWKTAGMDGVLYKPFTVADLAKTLSKHVGLASHRVPLDHSADPVVEAGHSGESENVAEGGMEAATEPLLDLEALSDLTAMAASGTPGFLKRILDLYFDHAPRALEELSVQIADGNAEGIAQAAHALRSMSVNIGVSRLATRLAEIERDARGDGLTPTEGVRQEIEILLTQTIDALRARFDQPEAIEPAAAERQAAR